MDKVQPIYPGRWYGRDTYFGYHYDLHVDPTDTDIGARAEPNELSEMLKLTGADFVQTDCKGHPGWTSWYSQTPTASVAPGLVKDALQGWRAATRILGLPLHCHYSGIYDKAAGAKHPDWCILDKEGKPAVTTNWYGPTVAGEKMCPRGPYIEELLIPQFIELIDRYDIDGFWVDGDTWVMETCYCDRCRAAFEAQTGIIEPPRDPADPNWNTWWNFTRDGLEAYVKRYCDAVHAHKPEVLVATAYLHSFRCPGEPSLPTDWISGDTSAFADQSLSRDEMLRCDARFFSTRGKPWDIMLWSFHGAFNKATVKSASTLKQQAATIVAYGGNVQVCENPFGGARTGQLIPWRLKHIGELAEFVKSRQGLCQGTTTIPQVVVLHSEHHFRAIQTVKDFFFNVDVASASGAVLSLLECQYGVDVMDEWALLPRLAEFPVVVAPEQDQMSASMVTALQDYVRGGGRLLVSGAAAIERFGEDFLGQRAGERVAEKSYYVPVGDQSVQVNSKTWRLTEPTDAKVLAHLGKTAFRTEWILPHPAATLNRVGAGLVVYMPGDIFRNFSETRFPMIRSFVQQVMAALTGPLDIEVRAPAVVDVVLRQTAGRQLIHLVNRALTRTEDVLPVGPIEVRVRRIGSPRRVYQAFEDSGLTCTPGQDGALHITIPSLSIHSAIVIEM